MAKCGKNQVNFEGKCKTINPSYSDKVRFYANKNNHTLITSETKDLGKGWCEVRVGNFSEKQRGGCDVSRLKEKEYPEYKEVSIFTEDSYHAPESGKVTNYGTHDYNLQFSKLKPINSPYEVLDPVKSTKKSAFGKPLKNVQFHEWEYVVLNWKPEGNTTKLQITHSVDNPLTKEKKVIYESPEYDISEKDTAIKKFHDLVKEVK